jgi:hypothetical protein
MTPLPVAIDVVELRAAVRQALAAAIEDGRLPARPSPAVVRHIADVLGTVTGTTTTASADIDASTTTTTVVDTSATKAPGHRQPGAFIREDGRASAPSATA